MPEFSRPPKDEYYLGIAEKVCKRSTCLRRQYGAIIVKNDTIVSTGYNGPVRGGLNCFEVGCIKDELNAPHGSAYEFCPAVHAEENAIINAARSGVSVVGGTMYIYGEDRRSGKIVAAMPCERCKRAIINAGIKEVVIKKEDGSIEKIDVNRWIREDTWKYLKRFEEVQREKTKTTEGSST